MKLLNSLLQRQVVQLYSARPKPVQLDFTIEALKCHKDDQHKVRGIDTEVDVPPFACSFNKSLLKGHMLAVADEDGSICLFDLRKQGPCSKLKGWVAHSNAIFDIAWAHGEPKLVTASGDQTAQLWDVQQSTRLAVFRGHSCSLKSVDFQEENPFVFATGARDGNIMIWDVRCNKRNEYYQPVNTIRNCHSTLSSATPQRTKKRGRRPSVVVSQDSQQSVTSVQFQGIDTIISAGAMDGNIKVWDLRKNYSTIRGEPVPCHVFPYPGSGSRKRGFSSLTLDSTKSKLFANCTNDVIYMYDCISFKKTPLSCFHGHSNATFYVKSAVSPDDQFLMSGSGDCDAYIWKISEPNAIPFHLTGHVGEVTSVAWCPQDQGKVVTCSDDNNLKVWRLNNASKNDTEFVGWCERKPQLKIPSEKLDNLQSKITTPSTSPARSQNSSTSSSPVSLSPNQAKCGSPQQFLQSWLKSNTNKRPRENDCTVNKNKRYCLEGKTLVNRGALVENCSDIGTIDKNSSPSTSSHERSTPKTCQNQGNCETSVASLTQEEATESDKENVQENRKMKCKHEPQHCNKGQHLHSGKEDSLLIKRTNAEINQSGLTVAQNDQERTVELEDKRQNWLETSMRTKTINNKSFLKESTSEQDSKKEKTCQRQPISPLVAELCSPDKEFAAVLKNMKSIKEYFKILPVMDSPSKYCER